MIRGYQGTVEDTVLFPEGGGQVCSDSRFLSGGRQPIIWPSFAGNFMKMKEIRTGWGVLTFGSANGDRGENFEK